MYVYRTENGECIASSSHSTHAYDAVGTTNDVNVVNVVSADNADNAYNADNADNADNDVVNRTNVIYQKTAIFLGKSEQVHYL